MRVLLALGSNLGDRVAHLRGAVRALGGCCAIGQVSSIHESAPMYVEDQPAFCNAVLEAWTGLSPLALLAALKRIETGMGRQQGGIRHGPRPIDLDILDCAGMRVCHPRLCVPHPQLHERNFVLVPLREICPGWVHPLTGRGIDALIDALERPGALRRLNSRLSFPV